MLMLDCEESDTCQLAFNAISQLGFALNLFKDGLDRSGFHNISLAKVSLQF